MNTTRSDVTQNGQRLGFVGGVSLLILVALLSACTDSPFLTALQAKVAAANADTPVLAQVTSPQFLPAAGRYFGPQNLTLSSDAGATIRYTVDGTEPNAATGTLYAGAFPVARSATVKAIAYQDGKRDSGVGSAVFVIMTTLALAPNVDTPTSSSLHVSWAAVANATAYLVYRDTSAGGSFATKAYEGTDTSFVDTGLATNTAYFYKTQSSNASGVSGLSPASSGVSTL